MNRVNQVVVIVIAAEVAVIVSFLIGVWIGRRTSRINYRE